MSIAKLPTALICGISGQAGARVAQHLLGRSYRVVGASRDAQISAFSNRDRLGIRDKLEAASMGINDFRSVLQVLARFEPSEIYSHGRQSSVDLSPRLGSGPEYADPT